MSDKDLEQVTYYMLKEFKNLINDLESDGDVKDITSVHNVRSVVDHWMLDVLKGDHKSPGLLKSIRVHLSKE